MSWTIDEALKDPLVHVIDRDDVSGTYYMRIGVLQTVVTIRLKKPQRNGWVEFVQSHAIKTPEQAWPYWTSRPANSDAASALHQAISGITSWYEGAVNKGYTPEESWLVPG